ncbi:hypothetical protein Agub_g1936, partial [Astrephomene gubernaculifera]
PNFEVLFERSISEKKLAIERCIAENKLAIERSRSEHKIEVQKHFPQVDLSQQRAIALVERKLQTGQYILGWLVILNILVSAGTATNESYISKLLSFLTE